MTLKAAGHHPGYMGHRPDVVRLVPSTSRLVLDVGCSAGAVGRAIQNTIPGAAVHGIERDAERAEFARRHLAQVYVGSAEDVLVSMRQQGIVFDTIIFADVLEHMVDPWAVVDASIPLLGTPGYVIFSLPNIAYWETHIHLMRGRWPMLERGIYDATHLWQFAFHNAMDIATARGELQVEVVNRSFRVLERSTRFPPLAKFMGALLPGLFTHQFIIRSARR